MYNQYVGLSGDQRNGSKVPKRLPRHIRPHEREQPNGAAMKDDGVTVGRGFGHRFSRDHARATAAVFNDNGLSEAGSDALSNKSRLKIVAATWVRSNDAQRLQR